MKTEISIVIFDFFEKIGAVFIFICAFILFYLSRIKSMRRVKIYVDRVK